MKKTINSVVNPTANLTINKSRLKIYNSEKEPTYYLKNGQEFQLELFNPTTNRVLAKIELNGNPISQGGIVLRPGERVFLERYLDVAKKFLFETYEVSGGDAEVKAAIQKNGAVKIQFYNEDVTPVYRPIFIQPQWDRYYYDTNPLRSVGTGTPYVGDITYTTNTASAIGDSNALYSSNVDLSNLSTASMGTMDISNSITFDSLNDTLDIKQSPLRSRGILKKSKSVKTETGRIEAGSDSPQSFKSVSYKFHLYPTHTVEYKILPLSEKINTTDDVKVKLYCHECGAKCGKGHKFCSKCGTKL